MPRIPLYFYRIRSACGHARLSPRLHISAPQLAHPQRVTPRLATGTLLTLFLLPFLYTVLDDMRDTARNFAAHLLGSPKEAAK